VKLAVPVDGIVVIAGPDQRPVPPVDPPGIAQQVLLYLLLGGELVELVHGLPPPLQTRVVKRGPRKTRPGCGRARNRPGPAPGRRGRGSARASSLPRAVPSARAGSGSSAGSRSCALQRPGPTRPSPLPRRGTPQAGCSSRGSSA